MDESFFFLAAPRWWAYVLPAAIALFLAAAFAAMVAIMLSMSRSGFSVSGGTLRIEALFYGREVDVSTLRLAEAEVVDLGRGSVHDPVVRTNGVGLPGFASGWMRLRGGEKSLVLLGSSPRALHVPADGFSYLFGAEDPEGLLEALRGAAAD